MAKDRPLSVQCTQCRCHLCCSIVPDACVGTVQFATAEAVCIDDARAVLARLDVMARAAAHGGYERTMTSDPVMLSRAIFDWWWLAQDNRRLIRGGDADRLDAFFRAFQEGAPVDFALLARVSPLRYTSDPSPAKGNASSSGKDWVVGSDVFSKLVSVH